MENVAILGSTGSIGQNALAVVNQMQDRFNVVGLAAGRNVELLCEQVEIFGPEIVALEREEDIEEFRKGCKHFSCQISFGQEGAEEVARYSENDIIISAITGINGLRPTLAAVQSGKKVALANKESMVVAGFLIQEEARKHGAQIIPVDSEHSAVFQCLAKERLEDVKKVILTASGGPFFRLSSQEMKTKSPDEALNHPRWKMGKKVTIDSATMMNKGLELIEARWLFDLMSDQLGILVHPQSIVHSLVEMKDGSVLAQLGVTDMRLPIQYALTYPERHPSSLPSLELCRVNALEFHEANEEKFPMIRLAFQALEEGLYYSVALNAANEVAVEAFLDEIIGFSEIYEVVDSVLKNLRKMDIHSLEEIFTADWEAREQTRGLLKQRT